MTLKELMPSVKKLSYADKLRLIQVLVVDLADEQGVPLLEPNTEYPIWTPLEAYEAADTLMDMLDRHKAGQS